MFQIFKHQENKNKIDFKPIVMTWLAGAVFSLLVICIVNYFFHDSANPSDWNPELKKLIPKNNMTIRHRSEGWGDSKVGKYAICGVKDLAAVKCPKILIWGDSYVQGLQMDDKYKMAQVLTETWNVDRGSKTELLAAAVAYGGANIADYYFSMPYYQKIAGNPICNIIFLHNFTDALPDQIGISSAVFTSEPQLSLKFNYSKQVLWKQDVIKYMYFTGTDPLWYLYKDIVSYDFDFRIETFDKRHNLVKVNSDGDLLENKKPNETTIKAWNFILKKIKEVSVVPVILVYCPNLPQPSKGKINLEDSEKDSVPAFKKVCDENNIDFIDMTQDLREFYITTHIFPRGFQNSIPYGGHINRYGHMLAAKAIKKYLKDHIDALHPD
jgi:hypothetical protein